MGLAIFIYIFVWATIIFLHISGAMFLAKYKGWIKCATVYCFIPLIVYLSMFLWYGVLWFAVTRLVG